MTVQEAHIGYAILQRAIEHLEQQGEENFPILEAIVTCYACQVRIRKAVIINKPIEVK